MYVIVGGPGWEMNCFFAQRQWRVLRAEHRVPGRAAARGQRALREEPRVPGRAAARGHAPGVGHKTRSSDKRVVSVQGARTAAPLRIATRGPTEINRDTFELLVPTLHFLRGEL